MIALLLWACTGPGDTTEPVDTDSGDSSTGDDTGEVRNVIDNPAEATDIDPAETIVHVELTAAALEHSVGELLVDGYGYNGQTPGPTIRARVGDTVIVDFTNDLDAESTIHWHGVSVPYEMDGVVWTNGGVQPGDTFRYAFTVQRAGTFWYHPHVDTAHQVDHGLYGVFIVEDPAEPSADRELVLVFDDWTEEHDDEDEEGGAHAVPEGLWTVNGVVDPTVRLAGGETARARLLNASNHGYLDLQWPDIRWIAGDQGLLPAAQTPSSLVLAPGDRAEIEWLPGDASFEVRDNARTQSGPGLAASEARLRVQVTEPAAPATPSAWPFPGGAPPIDGAPALTLVFTGAGESWFINGEQFPDVTPRSLPLAIDSVIELRNLSGSEHPFHIHGMHFEVLSVNDVAPAFARIEDTWNLAVFDRVRVRVRPQLPGSWMAHCHILEHAEDGMMTVVDVPAAP